MSVGPCPSCKSLDVYVGRCDDCPRRAIDDARLNTEAGRLISHVVALEFGIEKFHPGWDEVTELESRALSIVCDERNRYELERRKHDQEQAAMQAAMGKVMH